MGLVILIHSPPLFMTIISDIDILAIISVTHVPIFKHSFSRTTLSHLVNYEGIFDKYHEKSVRSVVRSEVTLYALFMRLCQFVRKIVESLV